MLPTLFFIFASLALVPGVMVIQTRHPEHSGLFAPCYQLRLYAHIIVLDFISMSQQMIQ